MAIDIDSTRLVQNLGPLSITVLLVLSVLVLRLIQKGILRLILLGLIAAGAVLVYANRDALTQCAQTCKCRVAGQDIEAPPCTEIGL